MGSQVNKKCSSPKTGLGKCASYIRLWHLQLYAPGRYTHLPSYIHTSMNDSGSGTRPTAPGPRLAGLSDACSRLVGLSHRQTPLRALGSRMSQLGFFLVSYSSGFSDFLGQRGRWSDLHNTVRAFQRRQDGAAADCTVSATVEGYNVYLRTTVRRYGYLYSMNQNHLTRKGVFHL
jgi:hypothetical protein